MPPRSFSNDERHRGDDRPTLPPIRDLFRRELPPHRLHLYYPSPTTPNTGELSQPLHPNAPGIPVPYSSSSQFDQLAPPDEPAYRGEQSRSSYPPTHVLTQTSSHSPLRPLTTPQQSPQRPRRVTYTSPTTDPHSFVPFQHETHDNASRSAHVHSSTTRSRPGYRPDADNYNPEPTRSEDAHWATHAREHIHGMRQYSYPPPSPVPPHQSYTPSSASRATPGGYQYARPMANSYSTSSAISSGVVALEPSSAKYECSYCGKGFTRPSSLRVRAPQPLSHL